MNVNPAAAPSVPVPWWQQAFMIFKNLIRYT